MRTVSLKSCAIVIPAFNERFTIQQVVESVSHLGLEVIVVDDASTDKTAELAAAAGARLVRHSHNQGKANALLSGFQAALERQVACVITLDGDAQHDPASIPALLDAWQHFGKTSFIIAARRPNRLEAAPKARRIANKIADFWVSWAAGHPILDSQSGFRLYPRTLLETLPARHMNHSGFVFESEIIIHAARLGYPLAFVETRAIYPQTRRASHFNAWRDIRQITWMIAKHLLAGMLRLPSLYCSLTLRPRIWSANTPIQKPKKCPQQPSDPAH
jgi:glycosyltransferase involved in cell wall biosynthesis